MPKHKTDNPLLQELYDVVRDLRGIIPIDGRSGNIGFKANVENLLPIVEKISDTYGQPTHDHPLLDEIQWQVRKDFRIIIEKASDLRGSALIHSIYVLTF